MIFLTVGHDIPFDRLVRAVDDWCQKTGRSDVFGQIADIGQDGYRPTHFQWKKFLDPEEFRQQLERADIVVAHAGTGTIISALMLNKPIIIMPRRGDLKETRNDHQIATASRFSARSGVKIARNALELKEALNTRSEDIPGAKEVPISPFSEPELIDTLRKFIF